MNTWTISRRVTVGFAIVIAAALALGVFALYEFRALQADSEVITEQNIPGMDAIARVTNLATTNRLVVYKHISSTDKADMSALEQQFVEQGKKVTVALDRLAAVTTTATGRELLQRIGTVRQAYLEKVRELLEVSRTTSDKSAAYERARTELDPIGVKYAAALDEMMAQVSQDSAAGSGKIRASVARATWGIALGISLAALVGAAVGVAIVRSTGSVLRRVSASIDDASNQVASAANQVSSSSQSLAQGSSEQAASLEETSASLEELASMTKRNAESAARAKEVSKQMRTAAEASAGDMEEMSRAMEAIKSSSDEISKIVKTIDEIAFQTNILALNAAVEAARAGEAGMGFAVVAEEVRSLAQRSAQSAKETAAKIEVSVSRSERGVSVSQKVAHSLGEIVTNAREADSLVAEIAQASREQEQGIGQLNTAVAQMDKVTQSNASNAEETASAAEELNAQAESQKESVRELLMLVGTTKSRTDSAWGAIVREAAVSGAEKRKSGGGAHAWERHSANGHAAKVRQHTVAVANGRRSQIAHGPAVEEALAFRDM